MKYTFLFLACGALTMGFTACKKTTSTDSASPVITVVEPTANSTVSLSSEPEIHIEFTTTDETALHTLNVKLIQNNTDTILNQTPDVDNLTVYYFHEHSIPNGITGTTPFKAILTVGDQAGNQTQRTINFFVEP